MTAQSFNTSILRKLREGIISSLRNADIYHQKHYTISAVNQLSTTFDITIAGKSTRESTEKARLSKIKDTIKKQFPLVNFPDITSGAGTRVDMVNEYKKATKRNEFHEEQNQVKNEKHQEQQERQTYLKNISSLIESKFPTLQPKITKFEGQKNVAHVTNAGKDSIMPIINYFVQRKLFVIPMIDNSFLVYKDKENMPGIHLNQLVSFLNQYNDSKIILSKLESLVRKTISVEKFKQGDELHFSVNTNPVELALSSNLIKIAVQFQESECANTVANVFNEIFIETEKVGFMLYIDPKNLVLKDESFFEQKIGSLIEHKNKRGFVVSTEDGNKRMQLHLSHDYNQFHFLPFNRPIMNSHVENLRKSISEFGFLDFVIVARTDVVDGKVKDWIVDRQHRFVALKKDKRPIPFAIIHVHSKYELIRLIAALNSKSRKWITADYLHAWSWLKMEEYKIIEKWRDKVSIMTINQAMTGLDRRSIAEKFQQGTIKFGNPSQGEKIINELLLLKPFLPKGVRYSSATVKFLHKVQQNKKFSIDVLVKNIQEQGIIFSPDDRDQEIISKLEKKMAA